ncbi:hypothetical protein GCM10007111_35910 [Virgibacillus kapii]|nr:hypothetical protein GCM10007111_35910 [Virgibacillus kapii]
MDHLIDNKKYKMGGLNMTVESEKEVEGLKRIGKIVAATIREMKRQTCVGIDD